MIATRKEWGGAIRYYILETADSPGSHSSRRASDEKNGERWNVYCVRLRGSATSIGFDSWTDSHTGR